MSTKKFLFLYSELAGYFLACLKELASKTEVEVTLVHWPINPEAPFKFDIPKSIATYQKEKLGKKGLSDLVNELKPDLIFCPGWIDKDYFELIKTLRGKAVIVGGMDNKFRGTLKQRVATLLAPKRIVPHFDYLFVPGPEQRDFALKLGFKSDQILTGYYSADLKLFNTIYEESRLQKEMKFPHVFIYSGRYYDFKGLVELWDAFEEVKSESKNDWKLWCLGTGDLKPREHPDIEHFGFVQPENLAQFLRKSGVFILASHKEPWAVSVHEFAAAGFPLLCSSEVGARVAFLDQGVNGYSFEARNKNQLKTQLKRFIETPDDELIGMMKHSHEKAQNISPAKWADTLINLL